MSDKFLRSPASRRALASNRRSAKDGEPSSEKNALAAHVPGGEKRRGSASPRPSASAIHSRRSASKSAPTQSLTRWRVTAEASWQRARQRRARRAPGSGTRRRSRHRAASPAKPALGSPTLRRREPAGGGRPFRCCEASQLFEMGDHIEMDAWPFPRGRRDPLSSSATGEKHVDLVIEGQWDPVAMTPAGNGFFERLRERFTRGRALFVRPIGRTGFPIPRPAFSRRT